MDIMAIMPLKEEKERNAKGIHFFLFGWTKRQNM
jgi:hypothetical protein